MSDYFYSTDGQTRLGPINSRQLKQLADEGILAPNTLIWKEGLPNWIPAERLKGLFPSPAASPQGPRHAANSPASAPPLPSGYDLDPDPAALAAAGQAPAEPRRWWYLREGQQTGPITRSAMCDLLTNGIVAPDTHVWADDMTEWAPARRVPALAPAAPPTAAGKISRPAPAKPDPALRWLIPIGRSPWAVASGYCGLLGIVPFLGIVLAPAAIITGIAAIVHLKKRPDLVGLPRAISGIILGLLGLAFAGLMIAALMSDMH